MIAKISLRLLNIMTPSTFPFGFLREYSFDTRQKYKAISYAWGQEIETRAMFCGFHTYAISAHVLAALNYLCYLSSDSNREDQPWYWIDAICIDQNNSEEKAQ
jgi:hypothetical protein